MGLLRMADTQSTPDTQKKQEELSDLNVKILALVDVPAVQGSKFVIAKSADTASDVPASDMSITKEEDAMPTDTDVLPSGAAPVATPVAAGGAPVALPATDKSEVIVKIVEMTSSQARAVYMAATMLEGENFYGNFSDEGLPEPMPDEVMQIVKMLRETLGGKVAKRIRQEAIAKRTEDAAGVTTLTGSYAGVFSQYKNEQASVEAGDILKGETRETFAQALTEQADMLVTLSKALADGGDPAMRKIQAEAIAPLLTSSSEILQKASCAMGLTQAEREDLELVQLRAREETILSAQLRKTFEAMSPEDFRTYLEAQDETQRQAVLDLLNDADPQLDTAA